MTKKFSKSHEWIEIKGSTGTVGITNYAQKELGEIVYAELPKVGQLLRAGEEACVLESTKAAADVYSPLSGTVIAVNESVVKSPQTLNRDPESSAWLFKIEF